MLPDAHLFEAAQLMIRHDLTVLPVADAEDHYFGTITRTDLFRRFSEMLAAREAGAIVVVEVAERDYTLGRLVHIVEQNDVKILSLSTEAAEGTVRITTKLNSQDTTRVRHILEHYDYKVVAVFSENDQLEEEIQERVAAFVRYLDM